MFLQPERAPPRGRGISETGKRALDQGTFDIRVFAPQLTHLILCAPNLSISLSRVARICARDRHYNIIASRGKCKIQHIQYNTRIRMRTSRTSDAINLPRSLRYLPEYPSPPRRIGGRRLHTNQPIRIAYTAKNVCARGAAAPLTMCE